MKLSLFTLLCACAPFAVGAPVDYLRDVKPILAGQCYRCHGATQQKSGLRLDTAAFALKGGEHGPGLKPGSSAESLILQAVKGAHRDIERMPYKKPPLDESGIATLAAWIDQGAKFPQDELPESARHWSFIPPVRPAIPEPS